MGVIGFLPILIVALIIFAIGWVLAALIEKLVESLFKSIKVDAALKGAGMDEVVKRAGYDLNSGAFVGALVKWFIIVVFLMASLNILGLDQVNMFLSDVVSYLPNVVIAVIILMVAAVVASAMQKIVVASALAAHSGHSELLGRITKWAIWIFAIFAALIQLGVAVTLVQTILTAVFAGLALAIGLAFGLGGKEVAGKWIDKTVSNITSKE
jgi:small-conductance mechanosensitive channel